MASCVIGRWMDKWMDKYVGMTRWMVLYREHMGGWRIGWMTELVTKWLCDEMNGWIVVWMSE